MAAGGHICRQTGTTFGRTQLNQSWKTSGKFLEILTSGLGDVITRLLQC